MTLASAILLIGIYSTGLRAQESAAPAQSTQQSEPNSSSNPQAGPGQDSKTPPAAAPETKPSSSAQQPTAPPKGHTPKKHVSKKIPPSTGCDTASASSGSTTSAATPASGTPGNPQTSQARASATAPSKNCPPEKIVVRQGGTADPSIQLAGADDASNRAEANQMLGSTEANLKKIAGLQLDATQRDTLSQIHRFVDQSKAALAAGDVDRGKTLASKAQMLSEDLVPQKQ